MTMAISFEASENELNLYFVRFPERYHRRFMYDQSNDEVKLKGLRISM
jgi:hypothetical protein